MKFHSTTASASQTHFKSKSKTRKSDGTMEETEMKKQNVPQINAATLSANLSNENIV